MNLGLGGPVGIFFATVGFSTAVLVARVWEFVADEAHCIPSCPGFTAQALRLHHFYYGVGLLLASVGVLVLAKRQRLRWDASLFFGIGTGLLTDEVGLLVLGVPYSHSLSLFVLCVSAGTLAVGTINAARRDGTGEFRLLDHVDILAVLSILLALAGVLYLDRPLRMIVQVSGLLSWASSLVLLVSFGSRHFRRSISN